MQVNSLCYDMSRICDMPGRRHGDFLCFSKDLITLLICILDHTQRIVSEIHDTGPDVSSESHCHAQPYSLIALEAMSASEGCWQNSREHGSLQLLTVRCPYSWKIGWHGGLQTG